MAAVAPELRSPLLLILSPPSSRLTLPLSRFNARLPTPTGGGVVVEETRIGDPPIRAVVVAPETGTPDRAAVLWIHSGGYVVGSPQLEFFVMGEIARATDAVVVSPDYRLAPEHPFPAALDDCMATLSWMRAQNDQLGIDAERIAVAGGSAGGGLAAAVAQRSFDDGRPLQAQALLYPMLDDRTALRSDFGQRGRFMWTPGSTRLGWTSYLGRVPRMSDAPPYAAPARRTDLRGLPPAWIGVGDQDLLYDEAGEYAERLRACGVECELVAVPGMYHAADAIKRKAASMRNFRASMLAFLQRNLTTDARRR
nr:alpha/beta hydrolase [Mycolicibacterium komanii]